MSDLSQVYQSICTVYEKDKVDPEELQQKGLVLLTLHMFDPHRFSLPAIIHPFRIIDYNPLAKFFYNSALSTHYHQRYHQQGFDDPFGQANWKPKNAWIHALESLFLLAESEQDEVSASNPSASSTSNDKSEKIIKSSELAIASEHRYLHLFIGKCLPGYVNSQRDDLATLILKATLNYAATTPHFHDREDLPYVLGTAIKNLGVVRVYETIVEHPEAQARIMNTIQSMRYLLSEDSTTKIDLRQHCETALDALSFYPLDFNAMFHAEIPGKQKHSMTGAAMIRCLRNYSQHQLEARAACAIMNQQLEKALTLLN